MGTEPVVGHYETWAPPTVDPNELGTLLTETNQALFGDRFVVERLGPECLSEDMVARFAFEATESGWTDAFVVVTLLKTGRLEMRIPPWAWDEARLLKRRLRVRKSR